MKGCWFSLLIAFAAAACSEAAEADGALARQNPTGSLNASELRCEYQQDPVGVDTVHPQLGWQLESLDRGVHQVAYQVLVARTSELLASDHGDLWDSGKVKSSGSVHVPYHGSALSSRLTFTGRRWVPRS